MGDHEYFYFMMFLQQKGFSAYAIQLVLHDIRQVCSRIDKPLRQLSYLDFLNLKNRYIVSDAECLALKIYLKEYLGKDMVFK